MNSSTDFLGSFTIFFGFAMSPSNKSQCVSVRKKSKSERRRVTLSSDLVSHQTREREREANTGRREDLFGSATRKIQAKSSRNCACPPPRAVKSVTQRAPINTQSLCTDILFRAKSGEIRGAPTLKLKQSTVKSRRLRDACEEKKIPVLSTSHSRQHKPSIDRVVKVPLRLQNNTVQPQTSLEDLHVLANNRRCSSRPSASPWKP